MERQEYELLNNAYYGTGLFARGKGLKKHPRESEENYRGRQDLAYYLNYTAPIVNASVDPIFKDTINREYNDTPLFTAFLDNCDRAGTDLQDFIRRNSTFAKLYGVVYILVNNEADIEISVGDNLKKRKLPYLSAIMPQDVMNWSFDSKGQLEKFVYKETIYNGIKDKEVFIHTWTRNNWIISKEGVPFSDVSGTHGLGVVPIVQWFGRNTSCADIKPPSEFISIAHANYTLYQLCSWHTQILRDQTFSILTMPDIGSQDITIGTSNVLTYPPEASHTPAFIAPDSAPANTLTDHMERLISEMYRMSGIDSVIGVQEAKSGVAKQWDFERTNQKLADFALQCEMAENMIVKLFEMWTGENINYTCEYPRDFKINDVKDGLSNAQMALDLGFNSNTFKIETAKKILAAYMPNLEPEIFDTIVEELEANQAKADAAYGTDETVGYQFNNQQTPGEDTGTTGAGVDHR